MKKSIAFKINAIQMLIIATVLLLSGIAIVNMFATKVEQLSKQNLTDQVESLEFGLQNTFLTMEQGAETSFNVLKSLMGPLTPSAQKIDINGKAYNTLERNNQPITGDFEVVDYYTQLTNGSVATIFAREGDDFIRVTTSLTTQNGARAFGTLLDRAHPAYTKILQGERFRGIATLFGKYYMTVYEPIISNGRVEGIYFIGYNLDQDIAQIMLQVKNLAIGDFGYFYILSSTGQLLAHPTQEGKNINDLPLQDASQLKTMLEQKQGVAEYQDVSGEDRLAAFITINGFNWTLVASASKPEILATAGLTNQFYMLSILSVLLLIILLALIMTFIVRKELKPIQTMAASMRQISQTGNLSTRLAATDNELGMISSSFNQLIDNMETSIKRTTHVLQNVANGEFSSQVEGEFEGDFKRLKQGVNDTVGSIKFTMEQLQTAMRSLEEGRFNVSIDDQVQGAYRQMVQSANSAMQGLHTTIGDIIVVMQKMQAGKFQHRVKTDAQGDLLTLKNGINGSMDALESAMQDITRIVVAQSKGDLTQKITAHYHGELRILTEAVNATAEKLIQVVSQAVHASEVVSGAAAEVFDGSNNLSQRVQEQAAALEQTSATMNQMNAAVQQNTDNAQQTAQVVQQVQTQTQQGAEVMQKTIEAMGNIQNSSHRIAEIVSLIDGIAFQTNLLALNAAVEAARAGEHGRGFAVVASEVRALAQKSANAAKDIKALINESVARIDEGTQLASQSGEMLNGINNSIDDITLKINQIAAASTEQSAGIQQVHQAIAQIDGVTQQNAALVEETSAASESLTEQAKLLQEDMAFFNTAEPQKRLN
ncbi:methyl-accepting chemotaxis protein [Thiomicrospira microaerophila]|uniref:methyl-accepting chemotaxis protein n=1 Tax=Thiomicrospira microaerophila TaxID=406020 RepID=UPI00069869B2|nr:Cache 3/Cache 2 fusion domain-containing protein [Thiomicrospira microaerophila]